MTRKTFLSVLAGVAAVLALGACGAQTTPAAGGTAAAPSAAASPATSTEHNSADVAFAQGMIPHHQQAVDMAQLADQRASNEQVKQLATQIQQAQDPEIVQLRGFLTAWGAGSAPSTADTGGMTGMNGMNGMEGMDGAGDMGSRSGMMSTEQMSKLRSATGAAFDRMFLQMMTQHHQGAIEMAKTELAEGANPDAKALAQKVIDAQQAEITDMAKLLKSI